MSENNPGAWQLRARSAQVVGHHYDDARPGKPLYLLIPGGLIALASLALIVVMLYRGFGDGTMDSGQALMLSAILAPFYIGGVFLFSYGYELYDLPKALRDTAVIVFITLAAVVIIAVLFLVLGGSGSRSSSSRSSNKSSFDSGGGGGGGSVGRAYASGGGSFSAPSSYGGAAGPIFVNLGSPGMTREVTHEVVREVPVAPAQPAPVRCPSCGRSYLPAETHYACPYCGAAATPEMIAESNRGLTPGHSAATGPAATPA